MPKYEKQKLKPDTVLKNYWNDNEHFVDLFNAVLFDGENIITSKSLVEQDTDMSHVFEYNQKADSITSLRDIFKLSKHSTELGARLAILGIENQMNIHYAMPLRVMEYDTYAYKKQYEINAKKYGKHNGKGLTYNEFLSKMKKTDKFLPIITLVIYYGEEVWDGADSLCGMLRIPDRLKPFVNDYKMNLIEVRDNRFKFHNDDNRNLFNLFEILYKTTVDSKRKQELFREYQSSNSVNKDVILALAAAGKSNMDLQAYSEKGDEDMCKFFDDLRQEGIEIGRSEGRCEGRSEAVNTLTDIFQKSYDSKESIIKEIMEKLQMSKEQAGQFLEIFSPMIEGVLY